MRKALASQLDSSVDELRLETLTVDTNSESTCVTCSPAASANRIIGAVLLRIGILLEIASAIVGVLQS